MGTFIHKQTGGVQYRRTHEEILKEVYEKFGLTFDEFENFIVDKYLKLKTTGRVSRMLADEYNFSFSATNVRRILQKKGLWHATKTGAQRQISRDRGKEIKIALSFIDML
ncbi:hypothetical protein D6827_00345 [Candidatus Parcubacteria bacterium]|nr:MAG: hypothetical protein D6827_00345 [Candidatus Parcubacteria bacterium]